MNELLYLSDINKQKTDMILQKVNLAYFSATGSTAKIVAAIESGLNIKERNIINLSTPRQEPVIIPENEIIIFGIPVFSGRVPEIARKSIEMMRGNNTPAIIACVYGNRDFDDALLELKDVAESNGFYVLSAGAFVAQHSIFPKVAQGRPDCSDLLQAEEFGRKSIQTVGGNTVDKPLKIKGNHPYRAVKPIPLTPKTDDKCNSCKLCYRECPVQAIDADNPKKTDKSKCISCAHCIYVCPQHSKKFGGLLYWFASKKFEKDNARRKESYLVYRHIDQE